MNKTNNKLKNFPLVAAILLAIVVLLHTAFMIMAILPSLNIYKDNYFADLSLLLWHILISSGYIVSLIYAYKKRDSISKKKINFIIYLGFLLYFFLSFSGCSINISMVNVVK